MWDKISFYNNTDGTEEAPNRRPTMNPRLHGRAALAACAALLLAALAFLDHNTGYAHAANDDAWQGTVTIVDSYYSERDETISPNGEGECSFTLRSAMRARQKKTTTYSDFQLFRDPNCYEPNVSWVGTARVNVTINASYYTYDIRKNARCGPTPPYVDSEHGYDTTTSGGGAAQGEVRFFRDTEPGSRQATCHIEADVEGEVAAVPEVGRSWNEKEEEPVKEQYSLYAGYVNFSFDCDPRSAAYSGQKRIQMSPNVNDIQVITWNIRRGPGKAGAVVIDGCAHLVKGKRTQLTAKGKPPGGTYSWSANPPAILDVSGSGEKASVRGDSFGRATVEVEYRTPEGEVARGTLSGSVAEVRSVNGGAAVPQIGLRDENGKEALPLRIPLDQAPPEGDLLSFSVADQGVASVVNEGPSLLIQGLHVGKTTAQAQTGCREKTGPLLNLDVVRCTNETIDKMIDKESEVLRRIMKEIEKMNHLIDDPELRKATEDVWGHLGRALLNTTKVMTAGEVKAGTASHAVHQVDEALEALNLSLTTWDAVVKQNTGAKAVLMGVVIPSEAANLAAMFYEFYHSWHEFFDDLKTFVSATDEMEELEQQVERMREELGYLSDRREKICGKRKTDEGDPPTTSPPKPTRPTKPPKPSGEPQPATPAQPSEPTGEPPQTPGEPSEPPIIWDPPFTTPPPRSGGFVIPQECGCSSSKHSAWGSSAAGLKALGADLSRAQGCAEGFESSVKAFELDLKRLGESAVEAQRALALPQKEGLPKLEAAIAVMKTSVAKIQEFNRNAESAKPALDGCGEAFKKAGELLFKAPEEMNKSLRIPEAQRGRK